MNFEVGDLVVFKTKSPGVYRVVKFSPPGFKDRLTIEVFGGKWAYTTWSSLVRKATDEEIAAEVAKRIKSWACPACSGSGTIWNSPRETGFGGKCLRCNGMGRLGVYDL